MRQMSSLVPFQTGYIFSDFNDLCKSMELLIYSIINVVSTSWLANPEFGPYLNSQPMSVVVEGGESACFQEISL